MSTRAKGSRKEAAFAETLRAVGWAVEVARPALRFIGPGRTISTRHDLFEAFDIHAVRRRSSPLYVQLTQGGGGNVSARRRKCEEFARQYLDISFDLHSPRVLVVDWKHTKANGYHFEVQQLRANEFGHNPAEREPGKWAAWDIIGRLKLKGTLIKPPEVKTLSDWNWGFRSIFDPETTADPPGDAPAPACPVSPPRNVPPLETFSRRRSVKKKDDRGAGDGPEPGQETPDHHQGS